MYFCINNAALIYLHFSILISEIYYSLAPSLAGLRFTKNVWIDKKMLEKEKKCPVSRFVVAFFGDYLKKTLKAFRL
jgi:hypothetical protein